MEVYRSVGLPGSRERGRYALKEGKEGRYKGGGGRGGSREVWKEGGRKLGRCVSR